MNSPEGPLFHKGDVLYGLHLARTEIARRDLALVVEGYTDVLALAQSGHPNVVASQGTALTERQLRLLRGLSKNAVLLFDADTAGAEAALRGVRLAEREGLSVRVAVLPAGLDPADAAIEQPDALAAAVEGAPSVLAYRVRNQLDRADLRPLPAATRRCRAAREPSPRRPRRSSAPSLSSRSRDGCACLPTSRPSSRRAASSVESHATRCLSAVAGSIRWHSTSGACSRSRPRGPSARAEVERLGAEAFALAEHAAAARALLARAAGTPGRCRRFRSARGSGARADGTGCA